MRKLESFGSGFESQWAHQFKEPGEPLVVRDALMCPMAVNCVTTML